MVTETHIGGHKYIIRNYDLVWYYTKVNNLYRYCVSKHIAHIDIEVIDIVLGIHGVQEKAPGSKDLFSKTVLVIDLTLNFRF